MLILGALFLALALACIAAAPTMRLFLVAIAILAVGRALFRTATDAVVTKCALPEDTGAVSGASDSAQSFCRVIAPALAGGLMEWSGSAAPAAVGAVLATIGAFTLHMAMNWAVHGPSLDEAKKND